MIGRGGGGVRRGEEVGGVIGGDMKEGEGRVNG